MTRDEQHAATPTQAASDTEFDVDLAAIGTQLTLQARAVESSVEELERARDVSQDVLRLEFSV